MDIAHEFFTPQSTLTLAGATAMTYVVSSGCQAAFNFNPRWLALLIAIAITSFGTWNADGNAVDYVFSIMNGFLVFLTAVGISTSIPHQEHRGDFGSPPKRRRFFDRWF
jgi:hypothetical protein